MIRNLYQFHLLKFPIVLMKKYDVIRDSRNFLYLDDIVLPKRETLFDTFNLSEPNLPETFVYLETPGLLLQNLHKLKNLVIFDDQLTVHIPCGKVDIEFATHIFKESVEKYKLFRVTDIYYYLQSNKERDAKYPILAKVVGLYFHVGWSNTTLKPSIVNL